MIVTYSPRNWKSFRDQKYTSRKYKTYEDVNYCNTNHDKAIIYRSNAFPYKLYPKSDDTSLDYKKIIENKAKNSNQFVDICYEKRIMDIKQNRDGQ